MSLLSFIQSVISVSDELESHLDGQFSVQEIAKGETLLEMGDYCKDMYYIQSGLLSGSYLLDGKEITNWFRQENELATCFYSYIAKKPSFEKIVAIEDTKYVAIPNEVLQSLYKNFPEIERLGRIYTEAYYIRSEERVLNMRFKTAKERYDIFMDTMPDIAQRVSLGQIASYLGISQETLSRMRSK